MIGAARDDAPPARRAVAGAAADRPLARRGGAGAAATRRSRPASRTGWSPPRPGTRWRCWRSRGCCRRRSSPAASRSRTRCGRAANVERAFAAAVEALPDDDAARAARRGRGGLAAARRARPRARAPGSRCRSSRPRRRGSSCWPRASSSSAIRCCARPSTTRLRSVERARRTLRCRGDGRRRACVASRGVRGRAGRGGRRRAGAGRARGPRPRRARHRDAGPRAAPRSSRRSWSRGRARLLAAAGDAIRCGEAERAHGLLDEAAALTDDPLLRRGRRADARATSRCGAARRSRRTSGSCARPTACGRAIPRRAAAMFLEASVAHMMTGDLEAMIATAERARALSAGAEPAVELLATAVIGEGQIALGEVEPGAALLRACEPYLMEADPLAIVEIVGMAAHACDLGRGLGRRVARAARRVLGAARDASAVSRAHPPAGGAGAPGPAPRPLGRGAGGRVGGRRARRGRGPARVAAPRAGRADAGRGRRWATRPTAAATWRGLERADEALPARRRSACSSSGSAASGGDRGARDRPPPDAAARPAARRSCSCGPT